MPGPVLIHIGYHKTGSGWLRRIFFTDTRTGFGWLGKDPATHPIRRLAGARSFAFDAPRFQAEFDDLMQAVEAEGLFPVLSFERLSGHPFSGGHDSKEIADRLAAVFPEGRVLVVLREQRAMILSTYKQYVREGGPGSLLSFLTMPRSRSLRVPLFRPRYFKYEILVDYYQRLFGRERVLALTYEQFVADPAAFVSEIGTFVGRPLGPDVLASLPFEQRSNPSPSATSVKLAAKLNQIGGRRTEMNPIPLVESAALWRLTQRVEHARLVPRAIDARAEAGMRRVIEEFIGDRYAEGNRRTAELTGLDLAKYGWMT